MRVTRAIQLTSQALVQRDSQLVKSDTISYSGKGNEIRVGTSVGQAGATCSSRRGRRRSSATGRAPTTLQRAARAWSACERQVPQSGQELTITGEQVTVVAVDGLAARTPTAPRTTLRSGTVTACDDSIPDYFFKAGEIKRTGSFVVARPAILYIGDVPVLWLPFLFQDIRSGRHSGILTPAIGVSDFIRNNKSYRRNVEGLGYYVALSDYLDAQVSLDWRSNAGEAELQRSRLHALQRRVPVSLAGSLHRGKPRAEPHHAGRPGQRRDDVGTPAELLEEQHVLDEPQPGEEHGTAAPDDGEPVLGARDHLVAGELPAEDRADAAQRRRIAEAVSGARAARPEFPHGEPHHEPTQPRRAGSRGRRASTIRASKSYHIDQPSPLGLLPRAGTTAAGLDTIFLDTLKRSALTSNLSFDTPITIFGYNLGNSFTIGSALNDFPERQIVTDVVTGVTSDRIYAQTYHTELNWTPQFTLPPMARNNFNFSPSLSLSNVDPAPFCLRNERTGGEWVCQIEASDTRTLGVADDLRTVQRLRSVPALPSFHRAHAGLHVRARSVTWTTSSSPRSAARGSPARARSRATSAHSR